MALLAAAALLAAGCGESEPAPSPEAARTPWPEKPLPVDEAAERLRAALSDCLGREAMTPVDLGGSAAILRDVGARSPGAVMVSAPRPLGILHVVYTPAEARAVVRSARHLRLVRRGRVLYEPAELGSPATRRRVEACIDEADRAAPVQSG